MTTVLWLLGALGLLGAFDTIYFHEIRGQLPARLPGMRSELGLHAGRSFIYVAVFGTLPWLAWRGAWAAALGLPIAAPTWRHVRTAGWWRPGRCSRPGTRWSG